MADDPNPNPNPNPNPPAPPWHTGIDTEILGHWQNKGWKIDDPKEVSLAATKQARELERHFGVPADQLLKMPKADAPDADKQAFYLRLGVPADAKDYDLSGLKFAGADLEQGLADGIRAALAKGRVPKDAAPEAARELVKHLEATEAAKATVMNAKVAEEKAKLKANWGPNFDFNHLKAMEGARKLGITPEAVQALEGQIGYAAVMDAMRRIGANTSEDPFHESNGPGGNPTTLGGARARLTERENDKAWGARLKSGDAATVAEWKALTLQVSAAV